MRVGENNLKSQRYLLKHLCTLVAWKTIQVYCHYGAIYSALCFLYCAFCAPSSTSVFCCGHWNHVTYFLDAWTVSNIRNIISVTCLMFAKFQASVTVVELQVCCASALGLLIWICSFFSYSLLRTHTLYLLKPLLEKRNCECRICMGLLFWDAVSKSTKSFFYTFEIWSISCLLHKGLIKNPQSQPKLTTVSSLK